MGWSLGSSVFTYEDGNRKNYDSLHSGANFLPGQYSGHLSYV